MTGRGVCVIDPLTNRTYILYHSRSLSIAVPVCVTEGRDLAFRQAQELLAFHQQQLLEIKYMIRTKAKRWLMGKWWSDQDTPWEAFAGMAVIVAMLVAMLVIAEHSHEMREWVERLL